MNLKEHRRAFEKNLIDKPTYIREMYEQHHAHLFDYVNYLPETDIKKIEITEEGVVFTTREHNIKILSLEFDYRLAPIEILNFSKYEPEETDLMLKLIPKGAHIFDIGGNAGWYSILFSIVDPTSEIFSFEPIPETYQLLLRNIALNNRGNIKTFNFGLSNTVGDIEFFYYPEGSGNASSKNLSERDDISVVECPIKKLDDCIDAISDKLDFIKCDVEGAELLVFQGAIESIKRHKPVVFSEMLRKWSAKFDYHPNDIIHLFDELGYDCFAVNKERLEKFTSMDDDTEKTNFFFLHRFKHKSEILKFSVSI